MSIPESKFDDWKGTGADVGSADAANRIEFELELDRSPVEHSDGEFTVLRQGSYKNDTHTWGTSDVDIIVILTSAWRKDLSELDEDEEELYNEENSSADYGYFEFRSDVTSWVQKRFEGVNVGDKAIKIDSDQSTKVDVDADIVPCIEYQIFHNYPVEDEEEDVTKGISFDTRTTGETIVNYPRLHYENGCDMHDNYKETVRIFKNARDYYNESWDSIWTINAPSYFIECLISNVPERILKRSNRSDRFIETIDFLQNEDTNLESFEQVSEMELLFGDSSTQWDTDSAETMLRHLRTMWDDWYEQHNAQLLY